LATLTSTVSCSGKLGLRRRRLHFDRPGHGLRAVLVGQRRRVENQARRLQEVGEAADGNRQVDRSPADRRHGDPDDPAGLIDDRPARIARVELPIELHPFEPTLGAAERRDPAGDN
jgi:hypothetical protein